MTAYAMRISDWSADVFPSDLPPRRTIKSIFGADLRLDLTTLASMGNRGLRRLSDAKDHPRSALEEAGVPCASIVKATQPRACAPECLCLSISRPAPTAMAALAPPLGAQPNVGSPRLSY